MKRILSTILLAIVAYACASSRKHGEEHGKIPAILDANLQYIQYVG